MFFYILNLVKKYRTTLTFVLAFSLCTILFEFPDNFKIGLVIAIMYVGLFYLVTKDFFISLFIVFVISSFFLYPAKNYTFEYASPLEYKFEFRPKGIFENISLTVADILGFFLIIYYVRQRIKDKSFIKILNRPLVLVIVVCWFIYYGFSLFSSANYSVLPTFSLDVLLQSGKSVLVFVGIIYLFYKKRGFSNFLYITLLSVLLFQSVMGIVQLGYNLSSAHVSQDIPYDVEERTNFSRVVGISGHPNYHAFATEMLMLLVLPFVIKKKEKYWWGILFFGFLNVIFSQSRSVWLVFAVQSLLVLVLYFKVIMRKVSAAIYSKQFIMFVLVVVGLFLLFVVPRLSNTSIFFTGEGGGGLRARMMVEGLQLLQQAPWTGFGIGTNVQAFLHKMPNSYAKTFPYEVHSAALQIALESGIPATLAFLSIFFLVIRSWFGSNLNQRLHSPMGLSIVCGIILIVGFYAVQPIYTRREYFLLGVFVGLAVANKYLKQRFHEN